MVSHFIASVLELAAGAGTILCSSLLQLQFPDNNILNGGDFGFEGSIICTVLMILMTGCIIWYFERKKQMSF